MFLYGVAPWLHAKPCHMEQQTYVEVKLFIGSRSLTLKQPDWYKLKWGSKPNNAGLFVFQWHLRKEYESTLPLFHSIN